MQPVGSGTTQIGVLPLAPVSTATGSLSGRVIDAVTGTGIVGATLVARSGINAASGAIVFQTTSGTNGAYSGTLPAGTYTVTASASEYASITGTIASIGGINITNQNLVLNPIGTARDHPETTGVEQAESSKTRRAHMVGESSTEFTFRKTLYIRYAASIWS